MVILGNFGNTPRVPTHIPRKILAFNTPNGGKKPSTKLNSFTELNFADFLKAAGLKLKLAEKDEWEEYFDTACTRIREAQYRTRALDLQIETLIGTLYGFSDGERDTLQKLTF